MTIYPTIKTGGGNLEMAVESALGTPGTYYDFRHCEDSDPAFPTDTREIRPVSGKGYWDPSYREAQLSYKKYLENAGTVSTYVASRTVTNGKPQCVQLLESMGCTVVAGTYQDSAVGAWTSVGAWTGTADAPTAGQAGLIANAADTLYIPYLTAANSGTAAYDIVPSMQLPEISDDSAKISTMMTVTPPKGVSVSASVSLAFRVSQYYPTSTETGSAFTYTGCAVAEVKPIVFESGMPVKMECGLHIGDRAFDQGGIDLTLPAYQDDVAIPILDGASGCLCGFADYSATEPITATRTTGFRKATWNPGITTVCVAETGTTTAVNGLGGFLGVYTGSTLELVMDVNKDWWTKLESSGSQTAKYFELIQPAAAASGATFGLWLPQCYMTGKPVMDLWGEKEMTVTFTLEPTSAAYTVTSKTDEGNQPWYFAVGTTAG